MAIGKEALRTLEAYAKQQTRIYPDACDYGIRETPEIAAALRGALRELKDLEGGKVERWSTGCSFTTRLGFEHDEGKIQGVRVKVSRNQDRKFAFFTIEIYAAAWNPSDKL